MLKEIDNTKSRLKTHIHFILIRTLSYADAYSIDPAFAPDGKLVAAWVQRDDTAFYPIYTNTFDPTTQQWNQTTQVMSGGILQ